MAIDLTDSSQCPICGDGGGDSDPSDQFSSTCPECGNDCEYGDGRWLLSDAEIQRKRETYARGEWGNGETDKPPGWKPKQDVALKQTRCACNEVLPDLVIHRGQEFAYVCPDCGYRTRLYSSIHLAAGAWERENKHDASSAT